MISPSVTTPEVVAAVIFAIAVLHTFSTKFFAKLAHRDSAHAGFWHFMAEVEVVFGFWALVLVLALLMLTGKQASIEYLERRNFTEPMFVFAIMVVAASKPILKTVGSLVEWTAQKLPMANALGVYFLLMSLVPLLGSFITEPAAMTLAALMLKDRYFMAGISNKLKYATIGVLFVNISIGGTLTNFAAPPVLMVAAKWEWSTAFMLNTFGWKAALAVLINAVAVSWLFKAELSALQPPKRNPNEVPMPLSIALVHYVFLLGVIVFAHYPVMFMGLLLFFIGFTTAYNTHQDRLILKEALLVGFFLAGLVVLGGLQQWWLESALLGVDPTPLFFIATGLTAITDNAALTYLASLVPGTTEEFRYVIVAGAVTGGGLTVIANAPNPAGVSILKDGFDDQAVSPAKLFGYALLPTAVSGAAFMLL